MKTPPKDVKEMKTTKDVKEEKSPKDLKEDKTPKNVKEIKSSDQSTPKRSDRGNRTPKKILDSSETDYSVNKDFIESVNLEDDLEKELVATKDPSSGNRKNKKFRLVIKPKSKQLDRYTSKVKNNMDLKPKAEKSKCRNCEKVFKNEQKLMKHVEKEHPGLKTKSKKYTCDKCSISFKVNSALKEHVENVHIKSKHISKEGTPEILNSCQEKPNTSIIFSDLSIESDKRETIVGSKPNEDKMEDADKVSSSDGESKVSSVRKEGVKSKLDNNNGDEISVSENRRSSKKMKVESENLEGNVNEEEIQNETSTNVANRRSPKKVSIEQKESIEELALDEPSNCDLCKEHSNNFSKLRRHQKYVHGIKVTEFKYVEPSEDDDEDDEEESEVVKETTETSSHKIQLEQIEALEELRSCLKKQNSSGRKRSISFNETIFYKEFNKEEAVCTLSEDKPDDEVHKSEDDQSSICANPPLAEANVSPRPVGRPRKSTPNSPISTSSPKSLKNSTPSPKKRKDDGEGLSQPSPKKQIIDKVMVEGNDDEFEADTALAIKLSLESATTSVQKVDGSQAAVEAEPTFLNTVQPMATIVLFPCEPCAISFESKQELLKHDQECIHKCNEPTRDTSEIQIVDDTEVVEQSKSEKGVAQHAENGDAIKSSDVTEDCDKAMEDCVKADTPNDGSEYITLNESLDEGNLQKISEKSSAKEEFEPKTDFVLKQELLSEALLNESSDGGGMVSFPMDSFLETILTEEPVEARLHDAIDSFTANLKANNEKSVNNGSIIKSESQKNPKKEVIPLVEVSKDVDVLSESLQQKYIKAPKRVDFTQSNFFMKHVELIGKSVNGGGFKEIDCFLPVGWKMKTFNEVKKFYLTPDFVVLKSQTAVIEYLRLSLDLSHDDLKSLSRNMKIVGKQFDRYLDELYDDCVVLE